MALVLGINYYFDLSQFTFENIVLIFASIFVLFILNLRFFNKALNLLGISSYRDFKQLYWQRS